MSDYVQTDLPRLTGSSISDLECPRKFHELRMGQRTGWVPNTWGASANLAHGTACHEVLKQTVRTRNGDEPGLTHIDALTNQAVYRARFPEGTDREEAALRVKESVLTYLAQDEDIGNTISVERPIEFDFLYGGSGLFHASCKIDRLIARPDSPKTLTLRDYKFTASPKVSLAEAFLYLWCAKKVLACEGYTEFEMEYDFIAPDNRITRQVVTGHEVRGQFPMIIEQAALVIRGTEWPECPGETCTYCPLRGRTCQVLPPETVAGADVF
jgi:hypothetical protein